MRDADVVVLSRFPEIFAGFREAVDIDVPEMRKVVIWDSLAENIPALDGHWHSERKTTPFHMAGNANHGWRTAHPENDIVYAGDDTRIIEPETIKRLRESAYSDPRIGIVAACVRGMCFPTPVEFLETPWTPFVFVYIKREVINAIGYLDERFCGYGVEDVEYCYRARKAGFKVGMAGLVTIHHGIENSQCMSTFRRVKTDEQIQGELKVNWSRFAEKYGLPDNQDKCWQAVCADVVPA